MIEKLRRSILAPHPMFIPCGHPPGMGGHSLPWDQFHFLFSLFLFKGKGSHLLLRGSALPLWIIIRILLLETPCEGQPAVTRGPKGLKTTNPGIGGWKWGWRGLGERTLGNAGERGEMWWWDHFCRRQLPGSQCLLGHLEPGIF